MQTEYAWIFGLQINLLGAFKQMTRTWLFWYFPLCIQKKKRLHNSLLVVQSQKYPPLKFSLNNILSLHFAKVYYVELKAY